MRSLTAALKALKQRWHKQRAQAKASRSRTRAPGRRSARRCSAFLWSAASRSAKKMRCTGIMAGANSAVSAGANASHTGCKLCGVQRQRSGSSKSVASSLNVSCARCTIAAFGSGVSRAWQAARRACCRCQPPLRATRGALPAKLREQGEPAHGGTRQGCVRVAKPSRAPAHQRTAVCRLQREHLAKERGGVRHVGH
jgi:hypothetical protein